MEEEPPMGTEGRRGHPERREEIPEFDMGPLVNPVIPEEAPPGLPPGTYVGPGGQGGPEDTGGGGLDIGDIEEAVPATTGYDPTTGTGYVPPGGVVEPEPEAPAPAPATGGVPQLSQAARDELARRGFEGTDEELIRIAAREGVPMQGFEGGPQAGVGVEDVSKVGTRAIRKDEDTGTVADYHPQGDQGSYGVDYTSPVDNEAVADLGDEVAAAGTRTTVGTTGTEGTVTDPGEQERVGKREKAVADKKKEQDRIIEERPEAPWTHPDWTMPPQQPPIPQGPTRIMPESREGPGLGLFDRPPPQSQAFDSSSIYEASGYNPFNMPTTAADFAGAGNQRAADMVARMSAPAEPVESYVPEPEPEKKAAGGMIEGESDNLLVQLQENAPEVLDMLMQAVQSPDDPKAQEIIEGIREAFGDVEFQGLMAQLQGGGAQEMDLPVEEMMAPPAEMMRGGGYIPFYRQAGGIIPGNGDAMADDIITTADAGSPDAQDIAISSGEYVVAGDVVSGLGSGNTERGAEVLDQLQDDVRMDRTGSPQQPPPINLSDVLPGTYGEEYA
tara:strand:- start:377 stop:2047 length:1671 start_codon:yes stop_codon:yes gene_type:complete